jgi:hypothetical protein
MRRDAAMGNRGHLGLLSVSVVLIVSSFLLAPSVGAATAAVTVRMLGEAPAVNAGGQPIWIAGIWHEVFVNFSAPTSSPVEIRASFPGGQPKTMDADYDWLYDAPNRTWTDPYYGMFVRADLSSTDGQNFDFVVGLDAQAIPGFWTLRVIVGGATSLAETVEVQAPLLSYGLSAADFTFQVEPFGSADVSSQSGGQYLRASNAGNIPLRMRVSFDVLQTHLSLVNPSDVAHPHTDARYYVRLVLDPSPPEVVNVNGLSQVTVANVIPSPGGAQLVPTIEQPFALHVLVGRSGYSVRAIGNVVFQTLDAVSVDYGATVTWQVYLNGGQNVSLDVAASGARLMAVVSSGTRLALPATLVLSPDSEYPLTVQVEAAAPGTGTVTFSLHLLGTGDARTFTTSVRVNGGPAPSPSTAVSYLWIVGSALAAAVFILMSVSQWRHRSGRKKARAATSEKTAKKGYNSRRRARSQRSRKGGNGSRQIDETNRSSGSRESKGVRESR